MSSNALLQTCTEKVKAVTGVDNFNACVVVIVYRKYNDAIGMHSDKSHKESLIATLVLQQDTNCQRLIVFESISKPKIKVEIFLSQGDLYVMDDHVQQTFKHGVPPIPYGGRKGCDELSYGRRLVVVFRKGVERYFLKDSGVEVQTLDKMNIESKFGRPSNLLVGDLCTKVELVESGYHGHLQKGVDGNQYDGAKSILLSFTNVNNCLESNMLLRYQAKTSAGAKALFKSSETLHLHKMGIRVFVKDKKKRNTTALFRYCGNFRISKVSQVALNSEVYNFVLKRIETRRSFTKEEHMTFVRRLRNEFEGNVALAARSMNLDAQSLRYLNSKY